MRRLSRKWKGIITAGVTISIVFYIEVLSYIVNANHWTAFSSPPPHPNQYHPLRGQGQSQEEDDKDGPLRVLLVADPQIIGENNEIPFLGLFTRWDADRYLQRNFLLAQYHTAPHVVAFLGDLFDEGSAATDSEYRRYRDRFWDIFQLPRRQDPSPIEYIFLPGDNDIGGEGVEPVDLIKVKWFNQTFGDFRKELWVQKGAISAQFIKMNLILPEEYQDPLKGRSHLIKAETPEPDARFLLSHTSLLQFKTDAVQTILDKFHPQLIFSAHSHHSVYTQIEDSEIVKMTGKFLFAHNHPSNQWTIKDVPFMGQQGPPGDEVSKESLLLQTSRSITLQMDKSSKTVHEISVPTCSYRMGVPYTGFGTFHLYKNGTLEYTVLWLPSRLNQLYAYLIIYLIMKFSLISWLLFKLVSIVSQKFKSVFSMNNVFAKNPYHKV